MTVPALERVFAEMPAARSLPDFTCGALDGVPPKTTCSCPPPTSVSAGPLPLYETCVMRVPASRSNSAVIAAAHAKYGKRFISALYYGLRDETRRARCDMMHDMKRARTIH